MGTGDDITHLRRDKLAIPQAWKGKSPALTTSPLVFSS